MDQDDTNQVPVSQETFNKLTKMVRKLLNEKERNPKPEDPDVSTRVPLTDLAVYSALIEAPPSIEEDFFCTPLTEEEMKEEIHSCHRSSSMNYHPPPLNESASSAVKKADACLHGIQIALAQTTRSIDYYVHRIIQQNQQANSEDPHILFSNTMRVLLADVAATVTEGRYDNLHKVMELSGKPQRLIEPEKKPLMDQEKLEALISSKNPEKRSRVRNPFCGRKQYSTQNSTGRKIAQVQTMEAATTPATVNNPSTQGPTRDVQVSMKLNYGQQLVPQNRRERVPNSLQKIGTAKQVFRETSEGSTTTDTSPKTEQEENGSRCTRSHDNRSCVTIDQESDRGSEDTRTGILQQSVRNTKEYRGTRTSLGLEENESPCTGAELQNRVPPLLLEWESIPVQSDSVRTITESPHIYKDSSLDTDMGENTRIPIICISRRSIDPGRIEGEMRIEYSQGSIQTNGTWLQNKDEKIENEAISIDNASWNGNILSRNGSEIAFLKDKGSQKGSFEITEDWESDSEEPSEFHRQGASNVNCITPWTSHVTPTLGAEEYMSFEKKAVHLAITTASNNGSAGSKKRKISTVEQQELVSHVMENQRCTLKAQVLFDTAVDIIFSNQRAVKLRSRYHSIQQKFSIW
ncbi:hypothetical protein AYI70_g10103 [Smittium culicis]|uniref:Uncharacterized protein n=1 Tax=Smittium culicis TaxID=133412 RepID=A0A1R1X837_9FUNG|nr:hypothetical protein AYI70_g10103 [Smittium culicis]